MRRPSVFVIGMVCLQLCACHRAQNEDPLATAELSVHKQAAAYLPTAESDAIEQRLSEVRGNPAYPQALDAVNNALTELGKVLGDVRTQSMPSAARQESLSVNVSSLADGIDRLKSALGGFLGDIANGGRAGFMGLGMGFGHGTYGGGGGSVRVMTGAGGELGISGGLGTETVYDFRNFARAEVPSSLVAAHGSVGLGVQAGVCGAVDAISFLDWIFGFSPDNQFQDFKGPALGAGVGTGIDLGLGAGLGLSASFGGWTGYDASCDPLKPLATPVNGRFTSIHGFTVALDLSAELGCAGAGTVIDGEGSLTCAGAPVNVVDFRHDPSCRLAGPLLNLCAGIITATDLLRQGWQGGLPIASASYGSAAGAALLYGLLYLPPSSAVPPSCSDGQLDGTESDIDCGGSCAPCLLGARCVRNVDCASQTCLGAACAAPSCADHLRNGDETDVDCGGSCGACADNSTCIVNSDCSSGVCTTNRCAAPSCHDGRRNGQESDIDCGGLCGPCANGGQCHADSDCQSLACEGARCAASTCQDGRRNGDETGIDCGGACVPCAPSACRTGADCTSGVCAAGVCASPSCSDRVLNGDESDTDCGGRCPPCGTGLRCGSNRDCASGICTGTCAAPTPWTKQFGTTGKDKAFGSALGPDGNLVVVGVTHGPLLGNPWLGGDDIFVMKLSPGGVVLWSRQLGSTDDETAYRVAVDLAGNIFVAGRTYGSFDGHVHAGGCTAVSGAVADALVLKLAGDGTLLWSRVIASPCDDAAEDVVADGTGGAYVMGYVAGNEIGGGQGTSARPDHFVARYSSDGAQIWLRRSDTAGYYYGEAATCGGLDPDGNLLVGGVAYPFTPFIAKLRPDGSTRWSRLLDNSASEPSGLPYALAPKAGGGFVLAGADSDDSSGGLFTLTQATLWSFDSDGRQLWSSKFGGGTYGRNATAYGVAAVGSDGTVLVGGTVVGAFDSNVSAGDVDGFLATVGPGGAILRMIQLGSPGKDAVFSVATDGASLYGVGMTLGALGQSPNAGDADLFVVRR